MATQEEGWVKPHPSSIDTTKLYATQWQVNVPGGEYDVWVDDIAFIGCQ